MVYFAVTRLPHRFE